MRDVLIRRAPRSAQVLPRRRWGLLDRPLILGDVSLYHVDFRRKGRLGVCQQVQETPGRRQAMAQAGEAFTWWSQMSAAERAATIDRLKESPTTGEARAEVKRKAKKTPLDRSRGAVT